MSNTVRHALVVVGATCCSRILGFVRDLSMAWLLGGGATADALSAALRIPRLFRRLLGEGALSLPLTVWCARHPESAARSTAAGRRLVFLAGLAVVAGVLCAEPLAALCAPGLDTAARDRTAFLLRLCLPYVLFATLAACAMASLHSRKQFLLPSLSGGLFNLVTLLFLFTAFCLRNADIISLPAAAGFVCTGAACGGAAQWALLGTAARKLRPTKDATPPTTASTDTAPLRLGAGLTAAAVPQLTFAAAGCLASCMPVGHMAALFYAERLIEFPLGVTGAAAGLAVTPVLAEAAARNNPKKLRTETDKALRLTLMLNLPATAGLAAVSLPLAAVLFDHGAFDSRTVRLTVDALWGYAPALPACALARPLLALCQATGDGRTPLHAAALCLTVTLGAGFLAAAVGFPLNPAATASVGLWCNTALLWYGTASRTGLRFPGRFVLRHVAGSLLTGAAAATAVLAGERFGLSAPVVLGIAVITGLATHIAAFPRRDRERLFRKTSRPHQPCDRRCT